MKIEDAHDVLSVKDWIKKTEGIDNVHQRICVLDIASKCFPYSYKITHRLLKSYLFLAEKLFPYHETINKAISYARAASKTLQKYPRIWIFRIELLAISNKIEELHQALIESFQYLPLTQHNLVWETFMPHLILFPHSIACKLVEKFLLFDTEKHDSYLKFLEERNLHAQAHELLWRMIKSKLYSQHSAYELSMKLCKHAAQGNLPEKMVHESFEYVIVHFSENLSSAWIFYADSFIRKGLFERARDIFERAMREINSLRDFGVVYNAYLRFEEEMLDLKMQETEFTALEIETEIDTFLNLAPPIIVNQVNAQVFIIERLLQKRNEWIMECQLRINPLSVDNWKKRLDAADSHTFIPTALKALTILLNSTVEKGVVEIIIRLAEHYIEKDFGLANSLLEFSLMQNLPSDECVKLVRFWLEALISRGFLADTLALLRIFLMDRHWRAPCKSALVVNVQLWSLYADLSVFSAEKEEVLRVYQNIISNRLYTPNNAVNFILLLKDFGMEDDAFKVAEKVLWKLQEFSQVLLWAAHISHVESSFSDKNIEVVRDAYQTAIENCHSSYLDTLYVMYADFEERKGLLAFSFYAYEKALEVTDKKKIQGVAKAYISLHARYSSINESRKAFQKIIEIVELNDVLTFGIDFASFEKKCGEIERARNLYAFLAQYSDPELDNGPFWNIWEVFEIEHGSEDTYRELLRIKRLTTKKYSIIPPSISKIEKKIEIEKEAESSGKCKLTY